MMATRLMLALIADQNEKLVRPNKKNDDDDEGQTYDDRELAIVQIYIFTAIWTTGACSSMSGRELFCDVLKGIVEKKKDLLGKYDVVAEWSEITLSNAESVIPQLPRGQTTHDFYIDPEDGGKWKLWTERIGNVDIAKDAAFHEIIVPTADTVRNQFLLRTLVESDYNVLISALPGLRRLRALTACSLAAFLQTCIPRSRSPSPP